jgi:cytochrome c553
MSNGDAEPLPEDAVPGASKTHSPVKKARGVKPTKKKRNAKAPVAKTPVSDTIAKGTAVESTGAPRTTAKRSKGTTSAHVRVKVGSSEMLVSRDVADALTDKDLKRLRALFKRLRKRAKKRATKTR